MDTDIRHLQKSSGIMSFTNNAGRARHSVRAAACQPMRSAGRELPAPPVFPSLFVKGIIPALCAFLRQVNGGFQAGRPLKNGYRVMGSHYFRILLVTEESIARSASGRGQPQISSPPGLAGRVGIDGFQVDMRLMTVLHGL